MQKGVFWLINDQICCFPFDGSISNGVAKSGDTYNHKKLWEHIHPCGSKKTFDYYPRGRVEITTQGKVVIYMSPHIGSKYVPYICNGFGIDDAVIIKYDYSKHYHCYLDRE